MSIILINDRKIAAGMNWRGLVGSSTEKVEIASLAKQAKTQIGVVVRSDEQTVVGLYPAEDGKPSQYTRIPAGAAWLAAASAGRDLLLLQKLDDGSNYWVVGVRDGLPYPGYDYLANVNALEDIVDGVKKFGNFEIFCSTPNTVSDAQVANFFDLVESVSPVMLDQVAGLRRSMLLGIGGAAALVMVTVAGNTYLDKMKRAELELKLANMAQAERVAEDNELVAKRQAEIDAQAAEVLDMLRAPDPLRIVQAWGNTLAPLPMSVGGWVRESATCVRAPLPHCEVGWVRTQLGTAASFRDTALMLGWKDIAFDRDQARSRHDTTMAGHEADLASFTWDVPQVVTTESLASRLQRLALIGVGHNLTPAGPIAVTVKVGKEGKPQSITLPYKLGSFSATSGAGAGWGSVTLAALAFGADADAPKNVVLNSVSIKPNGFQMEGKYVIR